MVDIVIPLRENFKQTVEKTLLEKSVSLLRKNVKHRNIFFFGGNPEIEGTINVPFEDKNSSNPEANLIRINLAACDDERISDPFIWSASDIFVTKPIGEIPIWHKGNIFMGMTRYDWMSDDPNSKYIRRCINTAIACTNIGIGILNFDCHLPCPINKDIYKKAYSKVNWDNEGLGILQLTVYGNYMKALDNEVYPSPYPYGDSKSLLSLIDLNNPEEIEKKLKETDVFSPSFEITESLLNYINKL